jgi:competence protein ComEA
MRFIREKLHGLIASGENVNRRLVLLVGLGVAAVVAILVSLNSAKPLPEAAADTSEPVSIQLPDCYVHVVGEVNKPGIYDLPSNSRVFEAIFAAGGFTSRADQSSVNLARQIGDGEQIIVWAKGQAPIAQTGGQIGASVSLNRGTQAQLEELPGVGPTLAARIIDWRVANGGFKKLDDLKNVTGIGNKLFIQIKAQATL